MIYLLGHGERTIDAQERHESMTMMEIDSKGPIRLKNLRKNTGEAQLLEGYISNVTFAFIPNSSIEITNRGLKQTEAAGLFLAAKEIQLIGVGLAPKFTQTLCVIYHY